MEYQIKRRSVGGLEVAYDEWVVSLVGDSGKELARVGSFIHEACARGLRDQLQEAFEKGYHVGRSESTDERMRRACLYANATEDPKALAQLREEEERQARQEALDARVDPLRKHLQEMELGNMDGEKSWEALMSGAHRALDGLERAGMAFLADQFTPEPDAEYIYDKELSNDCIDIYFQMSTGRYIGTLVGDDPHTDKHIDIDAAARAKKGDA